MTEAAMTPATMTGEQVADLLDEAHDVLLTRGRAVGTFRDSDGGVCLHGAVALAATGSVMMAGALGWQAKMELFRRGYTMGWNDLPSTTDDDVFDALKQTAKQLRG